MYGLREALNRTTDPSPCTSTHPLAQHEIVSIIINIIVIIITIIITIIIIITNISEQCERDCDDQMSKQCESNEEQKSYCRDSLLY